jgi:hypothetical protein
VEWALDKVSNEMTGLISDPGIRRELHSVRCLSLAEFRLYRDRRLTLEYLEQLKDAVDETVHEQTSAAEPASVEAPEVIPW